MLDGRLQTLLISQCVRSTVRVLSNSNCFKVINPSCTGMVDPNYTGRRAQAAAVALRYTATRASTRAHTTPEGAPSTTPTSRRPTTRPGRSSCRCSIKMRKRKELFQSGDKPHGNSSTLDVDTVT